ncbi:MAG: hypothetical protein M0R40_05955 [Firmicutes bacterium]|nr:hypothetical protein [Bacillota bacterium]
MRLSKAERETIISFTEADSNATIYTLNTKLKNKLKRLSLLNPKLIQVIQKDNIGSVTYSIPKNLVSVRAPVSDEQKKLAKLNAIKHGLGRKPKVNTPIVN